MFLTMVLGGQATIYVLRERHRFWHSLPARPMLIASGISVALMTLLAAGGILMSPLRPAIVLALFVSTACYTLGLDAIKALVFIHIRID